MSCGADAQIVCWEDVTEEVRLEEQQKMIEEVETIQKMKNMIEKKNFNEALTLSLRLGRPGSALEALNRMNRIGSKIMKSQKGCLKGFQRFLVSGTDFLNFSP